MLKQYQDEVHQIVSQYVKPYWSPLEIMCRLAEETGEVGRVTNHMFGAKKRKETEGPQQLGEELVDVIYTVICYANSQGINLDEAWRRKIDAQQVRDVNRFEKRGENGKT